MRGSSNVRPSMYLGGLTDEFSYVSLNNKEIRCTEKEKAET